MKLFFKNALCAGMLFSFFLQAPTWCPISDVGQKIEVELRAAKQTSTEMYLFDLKRLSSLPVLSESETAQRGLSIHPWLHKQLVALSEGRAISVDWFPYEVVLDLRAKRFDGLPPDVFVNCLCATDRAYATLLKYFACKRCFVEYGEPRAILAYAKDRYEVWYATYQDALLPIKEKYSDSWERMLREAESAVDIALGAKQ